MALLLVDCPASHMFGLACIKKYIKGVLGRLGGANSSRGRCIGFSGAGASEETVGGLRRDHKVFAVTVFAAASSLCFATRTGRRKGFQDYVESHLDGGCLLDSGGEWVGEWWRGRPGGIAGHTVLFVGPAAWSARIIVSIVRVSWRSGTLVGACISDGGAMA